ncbi:DUF5916 domain-containing protein [Planctomycetota bacterium]
MYSQFLHNPTALNRFRFSWGLALALGLMALNLTAQAQRPAIQAVRIEEAPRVDGRLDDACWQEAPVLEAFTQIEPVEGNEPSEHTAVRFVYTQRTLFIGIQCFDSEPDRIIATQMQHDGDQDTDDTVLIAFDTFNRQRDGYAFAVNPVGARADGLIENFSDVNPSWDTIWWVRSKVDQNGWTVEMAIPFTSLSFDPRKDRWGCNVERTIRRKQEVVRWTALLNTQSATLLSTLGELYGLTGMQQGVGLDVQPYLSQKYRDPPRESEGRWDTKVGGDVTYYITPSLKVNGTVNTDFAEAEVDQRDVNLTRFPLFFPEKRDFFLQDSSLFNFGGLSEGLLPYYSRRIGLSASGEPVDIRYGGRLTGRAGDTSMALLDVEQDGYDRVDPSNLFVARMSQRVMAESNVGFIATNGDPRSNDRNTLGGLDFNYLTTKLANNKQLVGHAWFMATDSESRGATDTAFGGDIDWPNEPFDFHLFFHQVGDDFDPALGFVRRRGIREYTASFKYIWRPNGLWVRRVMLGTQPEVTTNLNNRIVGEDHEVVYLRLYSPAEDRFEMRYTLYGDWLEQPFEMVPGVTIPEGRYQYGQFRPSFYSSDARPVSVGLHYRYGDYYTGTRTDYIAGLDWRPSRYVTTGLEVEVRQIRLPEGDFNVRLGGYKLNLSFSPEISWNTWLQYDNLSDDLGINSRLRWTYRPGSDFYFVVNHGWDVAEQDRWQRIATEVVAKVGATFRF